MRDIWSDSAGFTLLEVIVAIVIIFALAATFTPLICSSTERIRWAGQRTQDLYAERSLMERKLSVGESSGIQTIVVKGPGGFQCEVEGDIVQSGVFVSFVYPEKEM